MVEEMNEYRNEQGEFGIDVTQQRILRQREIKERILRSLSEIKATLSILHDMQYLFPKNVLEDVICEIRSKVKAKSSSNVLGGKSNKNIAREICSTVFRVAVNDEGKFSIVQDISKEERERAGGDAKAIGRDIDIDDIDLSELAKMAYSRLEFKYGFLESLYGEDSALTSERGRKKLEQCRVAMDYAEQFIVTGRDLSERDKVSVHMMIENLDPDPYEIE